MEHWGYQCAYCGSKKNITIDHIVPRSKGGNDITKNVLCCCQECNQDKSHTHWEDWYFSQNFFSEEKYKRIKCWMNPNIQDRLFLYGKRKNNLFK